MKCDTSNALCVLVVKTEFKVDVRNCQC